MIHGRITHWLYVGLYVGAIIIVARLVFNSAWDKGVGWTDRIGLLVIALASLAILKRINPDLRGIVSGKVSPFADRKTTEISANLLLTVLGIMASAVSLMEPRSASKEEPGYIEATITSILAIVTRVDERTQRIEMTMKAQAPPTDPVLQKNMSGIWGEDHCNVTYRYTFADGGLIVASVENAGMEPSLWKGGNLLFNRGVLTTTTIENDDDLHEGGTVSFSYKSEANVETLERNDRYKRVVTKFTRC
jgi:hypothetical protein